MLVEQDMKCSLEVLINNATWIMLAISQQLGCSSLFYVYDLTPVVIIVNIKSIRENKVMLYLL